ncbi:MAG: type II secretion system protein [Sedimentisphaerales bacterium]|nr:type II secretion system protein [Sedimentisphaerales bacterium]
MKSRPAEQTPTGFTLIELLVVIAIIGILLAVLVPALQYAKVQATGAICMANLNGLTKTWVLYAQENDSDLVGSATYDATGWQIQQYPNNNPTTKRRVKNFVATPQDENGQDRNNTVEDEIRGLERGGLWPYAENEKIYHCPSDKRYMKAPVGDHVGGGSWGLKGGYRTYSLGAVYNGFMFAGSGWPTDEYKVTVHKINEILTPGQKIAWVEEHDGYGYNGNTWNFYLNTLAKWGDPFAVAHNERSTLGYADGHAEKRQWQDQSTLDMAAANHKEYPTNGQTEDFIWFRLRYVPMKMPPEMRAVR